MTQRVLLTGATGFIGMEVLARLLERGDTEIVALVRAADREQARERIDAVLARLYERPRDVGDRLIAVAGDVAAERLGLSRSARAEITSTATAVVHCAASISFDLPLEEATTINTAGTTRLLDLAEEIALLERVVHVSTAYVAGRTRGVFTEQDLERDQAFRNSYEASKFEAERLVAARADALPLVVARPSIVVGDRRTGWTPAFNVIYWPLRAFARGLISELPVDPDGLLDVVPVDYVAEALVHLLDHPEIDGRINLVAGAAAISNHELITLACQWLDRPLPSLNAAAALNVADAGSYLPYFDVEVRFDDRRARAALVPAGIATTPFQEFFASIVDYADRARWGKLKMTREAAGVLT
jgi:thioester reductase-like protein